MALLMWTACDRGALPSMVQRTGSPARGSSRRWAGMSRSTASAARSLSKRLRLQASRTLPAGNGDTANRPCWINLEYLTAESWTRFATASPLPHPTLPLDEVFRLSGFFCRHGGLLRERGCSGDAIPRQRAIPFHQGIDVSLFC